MHLEARGTIFDATQRPPDERIAFFTSLCPTRSGAMLAGFQLGSSKHSLDATLRLCRSRDGGATWHELPRRFERTLDGVPGSLSAGEMVEVEPGRLLLFCTWFDRSEPARPLFDPVSEGILRSRQLLAVSSDEGDSWSPWQVLPTAGLTGCATTGPVLRWPDGTIAHAFESFKEFDDPRPARHAAWVIASRDGGRSFSAPLCVAHDPKQQVYYWDQRLCAGRGEGEFLALFWTHDRAQRKDLAVHLCSGQITPQGIHTVPPRPTTLPGQIAAPLWLEDGRLLAFVVERSRPGTLTLWVSPDGGSTWPEPQRLVVHRHDERALLSQGLENIDFKQYWEDMGKWSFGHPAIRRLDDRRLLLAFYAGTPEAMSIHWARVNYA